MTPLTDAQRSQLAQETAEHIATALIPAQALAAQSPWVTVAYPDDRRPPTAVPDIKAALLRGDCWISWMDAQVLAAMNSLAQDTEPCIDCSVGLALDAPCYAVDGAVVCQSCGKRRYGDQAAEYRIA